ncbi:membrane protein insertase YidC [Arachnia propionica]|uniref:membrane protein insertase YidC n=1 Tax=Arachnia propionica TaxID=1750 RepID=UPI003C6F0198
MIDLLVPLSIWDGFYGLLSAMMQPLYWVISGLMVLFHGLWAPLFGADSGVSWTLAIVTLTLVVRTLMIPLFVKQINSSRAMQMLQPRIQELQKKHGADRERVAREMQKLYAEEGVNPMASCFPLLLQMPVFWALFRVLQGVADNQIRGYWFQASPDLVASLQGADLFGAKLAGRIFPIDSFGATQILGIVLIAFLVITLFLTQLQLMRKNMPPEALSGPMAQSQKVMLYIFPIMYAASSAVLPLGVLLYWSASNFWTMGQQGLLIRNNPAPNTPAYIDWEERMRSQGKDPKAIMEARNAKRRKNRQPVEAVVQQPVDESGRRRVVRQQVNRTTLKTDNSDGSSNAQGGVRRQPRSTTRSARKKK